MCNLYSQIHINSITMLSFVGYFSYLKFVINIFTIISLHFKILIVYFIYLQDQIFGGPKYSKILHFIIVFKLLICIYC